MRNKLIVMAVASVLGSSAFAASPEEMRLQRIERAIQNIQEYIGDQNRGIWAHYEQDNFEAAKAAAAAENRAASIAADGRRYPTLYFIYNGSLYMYAASVASNRGAINAYNKTRPADDRSHTYKIIQGFGDVQVEHYVDGRMHPSEPLGKILPKVR